MAKFNFNLKTATSIKETPIRLIIRWNGQTLVYATGLKINPKFWQKDSSSSNYQRARLLKEFKGAKSLNDDLDEFIAKAKKVFREESKVDEVLSKGQLKEALDVSFNRSKNGSIPCNLIPYINYLAERRSSEINPKNNRVYSRSTILKYYNVRDLLLQLNKRIDFEDIDLDLHANLTKHLANQGLAINAIGKYVQTLKAILNCATEDGVNTNLKYQSKNFKTPSEEVDHPYLSPEDIEQIYRVDLSNNERLDKVRDLFVLGCWTGLRFSDYSTLTEDNINEDGMLEIITYKTNYKVIIPMHPIVKAIFNKYSYKLPRAYSNQKFNVHLKEVGRLAGIDEPYTRKITKGGLKVSICKPKYEFLSSHAARRSFATNLYNDGFPALNIMKITGHKTEKAFLRYIKFSKKESALKLQAHWDQKSNLKLA